MTDLLPDAAQTQALEAATVASGAVTGRDLMERAGHGAVEAILDEWPDLARAPGRALVLCGPGNNGGDGFVVARHLAQRGWTMDVRLLGDSARLPPDARANLDRWRTVGALRPLDGPAPLWTDAPPDLVVDALFGIGLARPFAPPAALRLLTQSRDPLAPRPPRVVALDVASGLDAWSGRVLGHATDDPDGLRADLTVAFGHARPGHDLGCGVARSGGLRVVDIGLPPPGDGGRTWLRRVGRPRPDPAGGPWAGDKARPDLDRGGHKYDHGHALVLAGGFGRTGAARLAARAALRIGAGLVTVAAPGGAMLECAAQLTTIMLRRCDDAGALRAMLEDPRLNALCLGPGLGTDDRAAGLVAAALAAGRATVLDADALTVLAGRDAPFDGLHAACVLTPHAGEFARLFPDIAARLAAPATRGPAFSKVDAAREAAARAGCVLAIKGRTTVIADPGGAARLHAATRDRAAPWLATAGTGDVLAGMVTGLLARGIAPMDAVAAACWCHTEAALHVGPGLIAGDLPECLPAVLAALAGAD